MLNIKGITQQANRVLDQVSHIPATVGEIAQNTGLSPEYCELALTQMEMAGLVVKEKGCFLRCH